MATTKVTREDLYEQVWSTPMSRLAANYRVSDVALAKTCRRLGVPHPGRGYWARVAAGAREKRPPLPKAKAGQEGWTFSHRSESAAPRTPGPKPPPVPTSESLENAHDAVRAIGRLLPRAKQDPHGRLVVMSGTHPLLAVTLATHRRALLLLDALCKAMASRGHRVSLRSERGGPAQLLLAVQDVVVEASVVERLDRRERPATDDEKRRFAYRAKPPIFYDEVPSGRLQLALHGVSCARSSWSDTRTQKIESSLGRAVLAAEGEVEAQRLRREAAVRAEIDRRRRADEEQQRARLAGEREEHARYEKALVEDLEQMANGWRAATEIREFLQAVSRAVPDGQRGEGLVAWLGWATSYAAKLDPLSRPTEIAKRLQPERT